jgi:hypothetical protein
MLEKNQKDRINIFIIYEELKEFSNKITQKSIQNSTRDPIELQKLINEWNSNHNDLFVISQPDNVRMKKSKYLFILYRIIIHIES